MTQLCLEDMATLTRLPYRRVKDQMVSDVRSGMVGMSGDYYTLTSAGMDLLSRFKAYKRMHGQPLPTVDDLHSEDDRDDAETDNHLAEREDWPAKEDKQTGTDHTLADYSIADDDGRIRNSGF